MKFTVDSGTCEKAVDGRIILNEKKIVTEASRRKLRISQNRNLPLLRNMLNPKIIHSNWRMGM